MELGIAARSALLEEVWRFWEARDHASLVELLSPLPPEVLEEEPELGYILAEAWYYTGDWERSLALARRLIEPCARRGNDRTYRRRMNVEAIVLSAYGRLTEAEALLLQVLEAARQANDDLLIAHAHINLGVIADIRCRWTEALCHYRRAIVIYHQLGTRHGIGSGHQNTAMTYRQLGRYKEAGNHFEFALTQLRANGSESDVAGCEAERGLLLCLMGDHRLARAIVDRALSRFRRLGSMSGVGNALRILGIIAFREDRYLEARRHFEEGLEQTRRAGDRLTQAEIFEELAVLEQVEGNPDSSVEREAEAHRIYVALGAGPRAERMRERVVKVREEQEVAGSAE